MTLPQATTGRLLSWADERDVGLVISSPESTEPVTHGPGLLVLGAFLASVEGGLRTGGRLALSPGSRGAAAGSPPPSWAGAAPSIWWKASAVRRSKTARRSTRRISSARSGGSGRAVLLVQPAAGRILVPFEAEHQQKYRCDH